MLKGPVIAIDGPAGAGKSTVARAVAHRLGCLYLDSGAMYRAVALAVLRAGIGRDDTQALGELAGNLRVRLRPRPTGGTGVWLGDEDVTEAVRAPAVEELTPRVAAVPEVRAVMIEAQRALAAEGGVVMDGRDIGRVVLPAADRKFFLTADLRVRVERRYRQQRERGLMVDLAEVERELTRRDALDHDRMAMAPDAIAIDTSRLGVQETVERVVALCRAGARRAGT